VRIGSRAINKRHVPAHQIEDDTAHPGETKFSDYLKNIAVRVLQSHIHAHLAVAQMIRLNIGIMHLEIVHTNAQHRVARDHFQGVSPP
jgi:hypothetical protein